MFAAAPLPPLLQGPCQQGRQRQERGRRAWGCAQVIPSVFIGTKGLGHALRCYMRAAPRLPQPGVGRQPDTELGSHNQFLTLLQQTWTQQSRSSGPVPLLNTEPEMWVYFYHSHSLLKSDWNIYAEFIRWVFNSLQAKQCVSRYCLALWKKQSSSAAFPVRGSPGPTPSSAKSKGMFEREGSGFSSKACQTF